MSPDLFSQLTQAGQTPANYNPFAKLSELESRLRDIEQWKGYRDPDITNTINGLQQTANNVQTQQKHIENLISTVQNDQNRLSETINAVNNQQQTLSKTIETVNGQTNQISESQTRINDLIGNMEQTQATLQTQNNNIAKASQQAVNAYDNAQKALTDSATAYQKAIDVNSLAQKAQELANTAYNQAKQALTNANSAYTQAKNALDRAIATANSTYASFRDSFSQIKNNFTNLTAHATDWINQLLTDATEMKRRVDYTVADLAPAIKNIPEILGDFKDIVIHIRDSGDRSTSRISYLKADYKSVSDAFTTLKNSYP